MSKEPGPRDFDARGRGLRWLAIGAVALLLVSGVVVTATAAPGPSSDVKTAQYGSPTPIPTKGPCKGVGGEAGQTCLANAKVQYKKALAKCKKKKTAAAKAKCRKAAKKKWVG
jgi:hypothetical protein